MMEETLEKAPKTLGTMLDYLGLDASVKSEEKNGNVVLTVFSEDAGRIIGRKGIALHSLQLLLNRVISKGNRECPRISIDVDGYRKPVRRPHSEDSNDRRDGQRDTRDNNREAGRDAEPRRDNYSEKEEQLTKQAIDGAKEAKRWGDAVTLPAMNSKDRRIVHLALEKDEEIISESVVPKGETGNFKSIIVSVKQ